MSWSKIRKKAKELICPALEKRLDFHITSYHRDAKDTGTDHRLLGRGWVTLDGEEILTFSGKAVHLSPPGSSSEHEPFDRQELYVALLEYPNMSLDRALASTSIVTRGLAMADRRLGKRRIAKLPMKDEHPFVRRIHAVRCEAEGIKVPPEEEEV